MKRSILILGAALVGLAACNKQVSPVADFEGDLVRFSVKTAATPSTRATEVTTDGADNTIALTQFNVMATTGTDTQTAVWTDGVFTGTAGGNFTGGKYWPAEEPSPAWNFFASNATMAFASTGATIAVADCETDVVAEYLEGAVYKTSNALTFDHILCQLGTVQMKAPAGYVVTGLTVTLKPITSGTFDIKGNSWSRGEAAAADSYIVGTATAGIDIDPATNLYTSPDNDLWLLPGSYQLTASYTISKGDFSKAYTKHATVSLLQGQNNNLILPGDNHDQPNIPDPVDDVADIIFTVQVTPWGNTDIPVDFS